MAVMLKIEDLNSRRGVRCAWIKKVGCHNEGIENQRCTWLRGKGWRGREGMANLAHNTFISRKQYEALTVEIGSNTTLAMYVVLVSAGREC